MNYNIIIVCSILLMLIPLALYIVWLSERIEQAHNDTIELNKTNPCKIKGAYGSKPQECYDMLVDRIERLEHDN